MSCYAARVRTAWSVAAVIIILAPAAWAEPGPALQTGLSAGFASGTDGGSFEHGSAGVGIDGAYRIAAPYGEISAGGAINWARWESRVDRTSACWDPVNGDLGLVGTCQAGTIAVDIEREYVRSSLFFEALARWHVPTGPVRPYLQLGAGMFRLSDHYGTRYRNQQTGELVVDESGTPTESGLVLSLAAGAHVPVSSMVMLGASIEQHTQRRPGDETPYFEDVRLFTLRVTALRR